MSDSLSLATPETGILVAASQPPPLPITSAHPPPTPASPLPSPPSPHEQRQLLRSSEKRLDRTMSLSEYLLEIDPYRFASTCLDPLPIKKDALPSSHPFHPQLDRIRTVAEEELRAGGIQAALLGSHVWLYRSAVGESYAWLHRSAVGDEQEPLPLLSITTLDEPTPRWPETVRNIDTALRANGFEGLAVELYHPDKAHLLRLYPSPKWEGPGIEAAWLRCQDDVAALLSARLEHSQAAWTYTSVFGCGPELGGRLLPTLVVKFEGRDGPQAHANWKQLEDGLKDVLRRHDVPDLDIEFGYGSLV